MTAKPETVDTRKRAKIVANRVIIISLVGPFEQQECAKESTDLQVWISQVLSVVPCASGWAQGVLLRRFHRGSANFAALSHIFIIQSHIAFTAGWAIEH